MPAHDILESENIFVMTERRAMSQDIRPLKVLILNLMPTKIVTETQLLRKLSNTPLQIDVEFLQTASYTPTHTDPGHLKQFYCVFDQIRDRHFDGMIITGAPLDYVKCEDTVYWNEVCDPCALYVPSLLGRLRGSLLSSRSRKERSGQKAVRRLPSPDVKEHFAAVPRF